ncbi:MAG TPA: SGNH/GDSL hydrolase family protein [Candidatus Angelobacter sp.]|nr:SGNH/GDSL hydrolase family protein [Candidatus Angelobacter sp.]
MKSLLVIGDSIIWGQGLAREHKIASILARHLGVELMMLAHSGAKIGIRDSYTVTMPSAEVPCFFPTILQQLQEFKGDPASVEWVLMNGGINDVEVQRVFNPMIPLYELELHIRNYCGRDLLAILQLATQKFPDARIIVLGYYPVLSHLSRAEGVESLYSLVHGVKFAPLFYADLFRNQLVEHCLRFWKLSTGLFRSAVEQVNRAARSKRATFVDSGFSETNAAYAPESLLWECESNDPARAPDEAVGERRMAFELVDGGDLQKNQVLLSAVGHPNVAGAARMAKQCVRAIAARALEATV